MGAYEDQRQYYVNRLNSHGFENLRDLELDELIDLHTLVGQSQGQGLLALSKARDYVAPSALVSNASKPFYIAHRGGSNVVPEHTLEAYRITAAQGYPIELDVQVLADGTLVTMHDPTLDRMTTQVGNVTDFEASSWYNAVKVDGNVVGGVWEDSLLRPPFVEEVLREFGNRSILVPEVKTGGAMNKFIDALEKAGVSKRTVLLQSFGIADCRDAIARNWPVCLLGSTDIALAVAERIPWLGPDVNACSPEFIADAHKAGLKVVTWTVSRRYQSVPLVNAGIDAIFTDDPHYTSGNVFRHTDLFATKAFLPGTYIGASTVGRGEFYDGGWWGLPGDGAASAFILHGYLKPSDPTSYNFKFTPQIDTVNGGDTNRWLSVFLSNSDQIWNDGSAIPNSDWHRTGYHFLIRANGLASIWYFDDATATKTDKTGNIQLFSSAPVLGQPMEELTIEVRPTTIRLANPTSGLSTAIINRPDAGTGLDSVHLGRNGAAVRFKGVSL